MIVISMKEWKKNNEFFMYFAIYCSIHDKKITQCNTHITRHIKTIFKIRIKLKQNRIISITLNIL